MSQRFYPTRNDLRGEQQVERIMKDIYTRLYSIADSVKDAPGVDMESVRNALQSTGPYPLYLGSLPGKQELLSDPAAPTLILNLSVITSEGSFFGSWDDPEFNIATLDNYAEEYSTSADFTTGTVGPWLLGNVNTAAGFAPEKTYYFRFAAHNQSGDLTHNDDPDLNALLQGGWSPWIYWAGAGGSPHIGAAAPITSKSPSLLVGTKLAVPATTGQRIEIDGVDGIRGFDASNNELFHLPLPVPGTFLFEIPGLTLAPYYAGGSTLILKGGTDKTIHVILYTADGTEFSNRAFVSLVHGTGLNSEVVLGTLNSVRVLINSNGLTVYDDKYVLSDVIQSNVSTSKHGFAPKLPSDAAKFLDGVGAWDTIKDSDLATSDVTDNDVSTSKHGFCPKAPNDTAKFLRGDGTWAVP